MTPANSSSLNSATRPLRIAVAGATGRVGGALIAGLVSAPVDIVALTRKPDPARLLSSVSQIAVDFDAPATLTDALQGIDRLFISQGTSLQQVANEIALIDAAVAAGVSHIVKLSVLGPPLRLHPFDWHAQIEAHLATREIGYTMLRPSTFVDVLARAGAPVIAGTWGGAAGNGRVNLIDTRDVADAARVALLDSDATNRQRAFHLTGARAWSMPEIAAEMSLRFGRAITYQHRTPAEQKALLISSGLSEFVADLLLGLDQTYRESTLAETTTTVQELTGHAPRTLSDWLVENGALFGVQP